MKNVLFVMHVRDENVDLVSSNATKLQSLYPLSHVTIVYDGVSPYGISGAEEIAGEHLKIAGNLGQFTARYLDIFLKNEAAEYCIRIDPDTEIIQRMTEPLPNPMDCVMFSRLGPNDLILSGAGQGFTRPMAKLLILSGWLTDASKLAPHLFDTNQDPILKRIGLDNGLVYVHRDDFGFSSDPKPTDSFRHG